MGQKEKLIDRFRHLPKDFTFQELEKLLSLLGYEKTNKGKTSGSRVMFKNEKGCPIMIHKPHPGNIVKEYALKQILELLEKESLI
ncbi:MAG: type II toxin-antitoxin system HicA family toxin [Paludibacteraceae bacterium]|nr:type II toxin-antitoxin system HicA family toxin [Paludibacteraceae bacterium]